MVTWWHEWAPLLAAAGPCLYAPSGQLCLRPHPCIILLHPPTLSNSDWAPVCVMWAHTDPASVSVSEGPTVNTGYTFRNMSCEIFGSSGWFCYGSRPDSTTLWNGNIIISTLNLKFDTVQFFKKILHFSFFPSHEAVTYRGATFVAGTVWTRVATNHCWLIDRYFYRVEISSNHKLIHFLFILNWVKPQNPL